jgi:tetratricopeptide (TPR) repeat protein
MSALGELAEPIALLGDTERAAMLYDRLLPYAGRRLAAGRAVYEQGSVHYALGRYAATLGRTDAAVQHYEAALAEDEALGARPAMIPTLARYGELLGGGRAAELTAAAITLADELGIPDAVPERRRAPLGRPS